MRNRILPFAVLAVFAGAALIAGCSDEFEYKDERTIEVKSANLNFSRDASSGTIIVNSLSPFTADSDKPWCKVYIRDTIVTVAVTENTSHEDRAAVVMLRNYDDSLHISVTQGSSRFDFACESSYSLGDEAETIDIKATLDFDYTITLPEWIKGERTETGYRLSVAENATGYPRNATVWVTSDNLLKSFTIRQFGENDVAGVYDASYSTFNGRSFTKSVTLTRDSDTGSEFHITGLSDEAEGGIPVTFDNDTKSLNITNLTSLGKYSDTEWLFILCATSDGNVPLLDGTYNSEVTFGGSSDALRPTFTFVTTPFLYETIMGTTTWNVQGIVIAHFGDSEINSSLYQGFQESFMRLVLTKN